MVLSHISMIGQTLNLHNYLPKIIIGGSNHEHLYARNNLKSIFGTTLNHTLIYSIGNILIGMLWQFSRQWLKNCLHWFDFAKYFDIIWWIWYLRLDLVRCTFSLFGTFNHNFSRRVISQKMHNYYCRSSSQQPLQKFRQRDLPWFSLSCTFVWFENNNFRMQQNMYLSKGHICSFICYCIQYPSLVSSLLFLFHHHHYKCIWRPRRIFI